MAYSTSTLFGVFRRLDGVPANGEVEVGLVGANSVRHARSGETVLNGLKFSLLDGSFRIQVPATNDDALTPSGFSYWIRLTLNDGSSYLASEIAAPSGAEVDVSELLVAPPAPEVLE
jgi:hypothetical protein